MIIEVVCPYCHYSTKVQTAKIPPGAKRAICPRCNQHFDLPAIEFEIQETQEQENSGTDSQKHGQETEQERQRQNAPWENRSELGLIQAVYQTFKAVLFDPENFFGRLTFSGGVAEPLSFGILVASLGTILAFFWQFLIWSGWIYSFSTPLFGQFTIGLIFLAVIVFVPIYWIIWLFVSSGIIHLCLTIVKGTNNGYEATFRVVSYSQATQIWGLVPFIGGWIGFVWQIVVQIIGLRQIHETSYSRVIIALLIPVVIIFFILVLAVIALAIAFR